MTQRRSAQALTPEPQTATRRQQVIATLRSSYRNESVRDLLVAGGRLSVSPKELYQ